MGQLHLIELVLANSLHFCITIKFLSSPNHMGWEDGHWTTCPAPPVGHLCSWLLNHFAKRESNLASNSPGWHVLKTTRLPLLFSLFSFWSNSTGGRTWLSLWGFWYNMGVSWRDDIFKMKKTHHSFWNISMTQWMWTLNASMCVAFPSRSWAPGRGHDSCTSVDSCGSCSPSGHTWGAL